ncbi:chorismate-binding protein [Muriicola jejuensis]|uniref:isochorismate synthase n=1 Tax=Muriicola jejuensis TaxID=504488 RepID=A0A6P0UCW1_9FLAO|nr:chorismate-binding protein [Muriicola jejuensis]NER11121.1 isochorismate synthase [Muriicola jejuensis]
MFRYPGESVVKAIYQEDRQLHRSDNLDRSGFVIGPYGTEMPLFMILSDRDEILSIPEIRVSETEGVYPPESAEEAARYAALVDRAVQAIREGTMQKVVLSRQLDVTTGKTALEIFGAVLAAYPSAFCYCWYHPEVGCWVGASPESLLHYSGGMLSTMALAGTLEKKSGKEPSWGTKEREEQQIVTNYISEVLTREGISAARSEVETVEAGNLWHLRTTLSGKASEEQVSSVVKALHPTPAVCGIPLQQARDFIGLNEGYSRRYYTGFLGELHRGKGRETRLFVNLRCMEYLGDKARIFVGGGITANSIPAAEWEETRAKSKTILKVL